MGTVTIPNTLTNGSTTDATEVNANFTAVTTQVNGNIDSDNLADAGVTAAKLAANAVTNVKVATGIEPTKINSYSAFRATVVGAPGKQAISADTLTLVEFDNEDYDYDSSYDAVTNFDFTAPATGLYQFHARVMIAHATSSGQSVLLLQKDGTTVASAGNVESNGFERSMTINATLSLTAAEVITVMVECDYATSVADDAATSLGNTLVGGSVFEGRYLGPAS